MQNKKELRVGCSRAHDEGEAQQAVKTGICGRGGELEIGRGLEAHCLRPLEAPHCPGGRRSLYPVIPWRAPELV